MVSFQKKDLFLDQKKEKDRDTLPLLGTPKGF